MSLTDKQLAFVEQYLICWNGTEAARRAGYSNKTAQEQASRLLSNVIVKDAIAGRINELKATANEVLLRLASHSRGSIDDFMAGDHISIERARERGKMHLVKKIKTTTRTDDDDNIWTTTELELHDSQAATVQLAKILGQFIERVEIYDWRKDMQNAGLNPDSLADELFNKAKSKVDADDAGDSDA